MLVPIAVILVISSSVAGHLPDVRAGTRLRSTAENGRAGYTDNCTADALTVCNYQRSEGCTGSRLLRPTGLAELRQFVANAARDGLRVRAIGRPHSDNQNFCEPGAALVLMDRYLDGGFTIHPSSVAPRRGVSAAGTTIGAGGGAGGIVAGITVSAPAGATVGELQRFLGARGLAVAALYPAFNGVTIAGAVGTGAHGSSLVFPSALGSAVVAAELVNSDGDLVNITAGDELAAVQCHLGVLGVVTRMRLAVVLQFKVRVVQTVEPEALLTNGTFLDICKSQLWVYLGYYPHLKKAVLRVGEKVTVSTIGNASTDFLIPPDPTVFMPAYADLLQWSERHPATGCLLTTVSLDTEIAAPPYHEAGSTVHKTPAVGFADRMLSGDCPDAACPWHNGLRVQELEIGVPFAQAAAAIDAVLGYLKASTDGHLCFPLQGIFFRVERGDGSLLGMGAGGSDSLVIGFTTWRPDNGAPRSHEPAYAAIARILMAAPLNGRPHWAKNAATTFDLGGNWSRAFPGTWSRFKQVRRQLDSNGTFLNEFARGLGLE